MHIRWAARIVSSVELFLHMYYHCNHHLEDGQFFHCRSIQSSRRRSHCDWDPHMREMVDSWFSWPKAR